MRIGIFGGTFDPPHLGHLLLAERCREEAQLDQVWFLPSYSPPHKTQQKITRFEQRCEMVQLSIVGQPAFRVEPIEKELPPPSYTANTLEELHARHPDHDLFLIFGADSLRDLPTWHQPKRVLEQAGVLAVARPGSPTPDVSVLGAELAPSARLQVVSCPLIEILSREVRQRVSEGKSIRYMVPRSVEEFIRERKLYLS